METRTLREELLEVREYLRSNKRAYRLIITGELILVGIIVALIVL